MILDSPPITRKDKRSVRCDVHRPHRNRHDARVECGGAMLDAALVRQAMAATATSAAATVADDDGGGEPSSTS